MSHPLVEAMEAAFSSRGWSFERVAGRMVIESRFDAHHTQVPVHVEGFPAINAVSVVGYAGSEVSTSRAGVVAELLMRVNHQLTVGNFELDYDRGRVLFRATNLFDNQTVSESIIGGLVHTAVVEVDRLTPFLTLILRMDAGELGRLNLKLFLEREDLLPAVADPESSPP